MVPIVNWYLKVILVALASVLAGCSASPPPNQTPSEADAQRFLTALDSQGSEDQFQALFDNQADSQKLAWLWQNMNDPNGPEIVGIDQNSDGSWKVTWRFRGETGVATDTVSPQWTCTSTGCLLTDVHAAPDSPVPFWLVEPLDEDRSDSVIVASGAQVESEIRQEWMSAAHDAIGFLRDTGDGALLRVPDLLVLEIPSTSREFEQLMGASIFDFADTGALAWRADSGGAPRAPETSTVRVLVNPASTQNLQMQAKYLLMVHEQTHVATDWLGPVAAGQLWMSEGLAESEVFLASPEFRKQSFEIVRDHCPLSDGPPPDEDFRDPGTSEFAYAWSGLAVEQLVWSSGSAADMISAWRKAGLLPDFPQRLVPC